MDNMTKTIERPISELRFKSKILALEAINRLGHKVEQCDHNIPYTLDRASKYLESALYERQMTDEEYDENRKKIDKSMNEFFQNCSCTKKNRD